MSVCVAGVLSTPWSENNERGSVRACDLRAILTPTNLKNHDVEIRWSGTPVLYCNTPANERCVRYACAWMLQEFSYSDQDIPHARVLHVYARGRVLLLKPCAKSSRT